MMKRRLLMALSLLVCTLLQAAPVTVEQARKVAANFLAERISGSQPVEMQLVRLQTAAGRANAQRSAQQAQNYFYLFNAQRTEGGFVLVSGDDRAPAILAYSTDGYIDGESMPDNMRAWLEGYADQLRYMDEHQVKNAPRKAQEWAAVMPLLSTSWDQGSPYNDMCPIDKRNNQRSATGCMATSMAQLMNYYKYPERTLTTIPSYKCPNTASGKVDAIEPTTIDWGNMKNSYNRYATAAAKEAVATLMLLCGASVQMYYGSDGSGSTSDQLATAMRTYFGYNNAYDADRSHYTTEEWEQKVYNELAQQRPVLYNGQSGGGGHSFIIDGYTDGFYHVNWGWGGNGNAYFLLSVLNPYNTSSLGASSSYDGFSYIQDALFGVGPQGQGTPDEIILSTQGISVSTTSVTRSSRGYFSFSTNVTFYNYNENAYMFKFGIGVVNDAGELVYKKLINTQQLNPNSGFRQYTMALEPNLGDGHYHVVAISAESSESGWHVNRNSGNDYIDMVVSGNKATLKNPTANLEVLKVITTGDTKPGGPVPLRYTIKNNGTDFMSYVFIQLNNTIVGGGWLEVKDGQTADLNLDFGMAHQEGTYVLKLCRMDDNYNFIPFNSTVLRVKKQGGGIAPPETHISLTPNVTGLKDGVLKAKTATDITVASTMWAENDGTNDFNAKIGMELLRKEANGTLTLIDSQDQTVKLLIGNKQQLAFTLKGAEQLKQYVLRTWFTGDDGNPVYTEETTEFTVAEFNGVENKLTMTFTIDKLNKRSNPYELQAGTLTGKVKIKNAGNYDYDDQLVTRLCSIVNTQLVDIGQNITEQFQLAQGATVTKTLEFTDLKNGQAYALTVDYMTEGELTSLTNYVAFIVNDPNGDGIAEVLSSMDAHQQVVVYDAGGRRVARSQAGQLQQTLKNLPKGVYVIQGVKLHN